MSRKTNEAGVSLIKKYEGLRLVSYPDPATGGRPYTIGWGHTGGHVKPGMHITIEEAERFLRSDLVWFEYHVNKLVKTHIGDNQFAALVSFAFNCGADNLARSTLLRLVNARKFLLAADEFEKWDKASGKVMAGLVKRRAAERDLFLRSEVVPEA